MEFLETGLISTWETIRTMLVEIAGIFECDEAVPEQCVAEVTQPLSCAAPTALSARHSAAVTADKGRRPVCSAGTAQAATTAPSHQHQQVFQGDQFKELLLDYQQQALNRFLIIRILQKWKKKNL